MSAMRVILTPLRSELQGALKALGSGTPLPAPPPTALFRVGPELVLGWTGVGRGPTERAIARVAELEPSRVLHLGVAGGLRRGLNVGDARLITTAVRAGAEPITLEPGPGWGCDGLATAGCLTVDVIADTPARKAELAQAHPEADLVEMETWWAASAARAAGLDLTCARVVSDRLDQTLPDLSPGLDAVGRPKPLALARHLLKRPRAIAKLPQVAADFSAAERRLRALIRAAAEQ